MPSALKLALPRARRLKTGRDFARVRQGGRLVCGTLIFNWLALPEGTPSRLGVVTSKRLGNAVARNRGRRLMREAYRLHQFSFAAPVDLVLVARPSMAGKSFAEVERDFLTARKRAKLQKEPA